MTTATTMDKFRVKPDWAGGQCFIVCGGPSVLDLDLEKLRGRHVIVVNSSYITVPDADYLVFADKRWWTEHSERVMRNFHGRVIALTPMGRGDHYVLMERTRMSGLTPDPRHLAVWHTTATAAINLACHLLDWRGEIGLLGLDGCDRDDKMWHHEPHPRGWPVNARRYQYHGEALGLVAAHLRDTGVNAFQCNPRAAHQMFPQRSFEEMTK